MSDESVYVTGRESVGLGKVPIIEGREIELRLVFVDGGRESLSARAPPTGEGGGSEGTAALGLEEGELPSRPWVRIRG